MTTTIIGGEIRAVMFTIRGHNRVMNDLHRETMNQIRDTYLPFHFSLLAYSRYPGIFAKRSKRWQMIKARTVHHQRPNEWTGALRQSVLKDSKISATSGYGKLEAKAPLDSKIKFGPRAGQTIRRPLTEQRRLEMEIVSNDEIKTQSLRMQAEYQAAVFDPAHCDKVLKQFR